MRNAAYVETQKIREEQLHASYMVRKGNDFDKKAAAGKLEHTGPMFRVMSEIYRDIVDNFDVYADKRSKSIMLPVLDFVGPEAVANLLADAVVIGAAREETRQEVADKIGEALVDAALEGELMNLSDKDTVKAIKYVLSKSNNVSQTLKYYEQKYNAEVGEKAELVKLGFNLMTKVVERAGYFEYVELPDEEDCFDTDPNKHKKSNPKALQFSEKSLRTIKGLADEIAAVRPKFHPLVCEPRDWTSVRNGGYYTENFELPLVKSKGSREEINEYYNMLDNSEGFVRFREAVNEAQKTAFRVNKKVLALANKVLKLKGGMFDIAETKKIDWRKASKEDRVELKMDEESRAGKARSDAETVKMAAEYKDFDAIYFVYQADFRGRIYNVCTELNTQGSDLSKGLLQFAKGKALGQDGYFWLCIHAANLYGADIVCSDGETRALDKASFSDRFAWVQDNKELIKLVAKGDVKDANFIEALDEAENPMMFYATCQELAKLVDKSDLQRSRFVSYTPVGMDGSCNGQQWAAGFLRSRELATNVNLVKSSINDLPIDLYGKVRDGGIAYAKAHTFAEIAAEASSDSIDVPVEVAKELVEFLLNADANAQRKLFKRPTMTEAYAVTKLGQREMLWVDWRSYRNKMKAEGKGLSDEALKCYKNVYGLLLDKGLEAACMASRDSMDFFKSCARAMGDKTIYVTNPIGFILKQSYKVEKDVILQSTSLGKNVMLHIKIRTDKVNARRQQSAIAPNVTHSHDSAHMLMVVEAFKGQDMSWMLIHDDYATHACDVTAMNKVIRKVFVEIHSQNRLEVLKDELLAQGADEMEFGITRKINGEKVLVADPVSLHNDFDLEEVNESTYFFA